MTEYIEREAVIKRLKELHFGCKDFHVCGGVLLELNALYNLPAADVVERKTGEWINERQEGLGTFSAECSLCGKRTLAYFHYFYCPNCGAKMDGDL